MAGVELATAYISLVADTSGIGRQLNSEFGRATQRADQAGRSMGNSLATGLGKGLAAVAGGAALIGGLSKVISIGNDVTTSLNTMQAVSRATADQMSAVSQRAKELGNDISLPGTSASDAAAAMTELAKGGFSVEQSMQAAKGTLQLAAAAQIDAAQAATIQSQALQAFGKDASYAAKTADVLANTANASSAEITDVAYGLQASGAVAHQFGLTMEDTATALALFANSGIQGSDAGTLLKSALLALTDQGEPAQGAIEELGLSVYNAQGQFVGLEALFGQLQTASKRMTPEMYQAATATLFGSDAARLAGIAAEQGAGGFANMETAINRQGAAAEVAAAKTQGLPGAMSALENSAETLALGLYDLIDGPMADYATKGANAISGATPKIIGGLESTGSAVGGLMSTLGDLPPAVQLGLGALVAGKVSTALFGDQLNAASGKVKDLGIAAKSNAGNLASFGAEIRRTQEFAALAGRPMGTLSATMMTLGTESEGALGRMGRAYTSAADNATRFHSAAGLAASAGSGLKTAAGGLVGALGGPWGLAITGAVAGLGLLFNAHQNAARAAEEQRAKEEALQATLDANSGKATQQTIDAVAKDLQKQGMLEKAHAAGVNLQDFSRAAAGVDDAGQKRITDQLANQIQGNLGDAGAGATAKQIADAGVSQEQLAQALAGSQPAIDAYNASMDAYAVKTHAAKISLDGLREILPEAGQRASDLGGALNGTAASADSAGGKARELKEATLGLYEVTEQGSQSFRDLGLTIQQVPDNKTIIVDAPTAEQEQRLKDLGYTVEHLPDGSVKVTLNDQQARDQIQALVNTPWTTNVQVKWTVDQIDLSVAARQAGADPGTTITGGHVGGRAEGGPIFGAGTSTSDSILIRASDGEFMQRASAVDYYGADFMHALNNRQIDKRSLPGFAQGGLISAYKYAKGMQGTGYQMGGFGPGGIDCSAFVSAVINAAFGSDPYSSRMSTVTEGDWLSARGAKMGAGRGDIMVGWWDQGGGANGHTAGTFGNGTNFESNGSQGVVIGGSTGASDASFTNRAYFPLGFFGGGQLQFSDPGLSGFADSTDPAKPGNLKIPGQSSSGSDPEVDPRLARKAELSDTISGRFGDAAKELVGGQVSSLLGAFGFPDDPPALKAANEFQKAQEDYKSYQDKVREFDSKQANGAPPEPNTSAGENNAGDTGVIYDPAKGAAQWSPVAEQALTLLNIPLTNVARTIEQIGIESSGNPDAVGPDSADGAPVGLLQVKPGTFAAYKSSELPGGSRDPLANIFAGANYATDRYDALEKIWPTKAGYDQGGWLAPGLTLVENKTGVPEPVLNPQQWATMAALAEGNGGNAGYTHNWNITGSNADEIARKVMTIFRRSQARHMGRNFQNV